MGRKGGRRKRREKKLGGRGDGEEEMGKGVKK